MGKTSAFSFTPIRAFMDAFIFMSYTELVPHTKQRVGERHFHADRGTIDRGVLYPCGPFVGGHLRATARPPHPLLRRRETGIVLERRVISYLEKQLNRFYRKNMETDGETDRETDRETDTSTSTRVRNIRTM